MAQLWKVVQWVGGPQKQRRPSYASLSPPSPATVQRTASSLPCPHTHNNQGNHRGLPASSTQLWMGAFLSFSRLMKPTTEVGRIQGLERPWVLFGASPREGWVVGACRRPRGPKRAYIISQKMVQPL